MFDFSKNLQNDPQGSFEFQVINYRGGHRSRVSCYDGTDKRVAKGENARYL